MPIAPVRKDHRPYRLKRAMSLLNDAYANHFLVPQFESVGTGLRVTNPRYVEVSGRGVRLGHDIHMMATRDRPIRFTSWPQGVDTWGDITIGAYSIVLPGTRLASATRIEVGKNCMFATNAYVTDADWHDIYDRTAAPGGTAPVTLRDNVWIGDSAIVCKGVTIGENSVIGTGAIVTKDIPDNVVAAGNPARVVKELDPAEELRRREALCHGEQDYARYVDGFDRWVLHSNRFTTWLRSIVWPTREL